MSKDDEGAPKVAKFTPPEGSPMAKNMEIFEGWIERNKDAIETGDADAFKAVAAQLAKALSSSAATVRNEDVLKNMAARLDAGRRAWAARMTAAKMDTFKDANAEVAERYSSLASQVNKYLTKF